MKPFGTAARDVSEASRAAVPTESRGSVREHPRPRAIPSIPKIPQSSFLLFALPLFGFSGFSERELSLGGV
jgi:hypothetical protein